MKKVIAILFASFLFCSYAQAQDQGSINGEWDTNGQHYSNTPNGDKWRDDGTYMQKSAGGYIDTKTGQFVPAN